MTVTDQHKIIDNKISANQAPYDLDRLAAKISPYSSGDFRKYEYLTGEDLGYKPSVVEQAKFEYFQLGKICNKELPEEDKKEGLFKRLETIKGKNEELLKEIKNQKAEKSDSQTTKAKNPLFYDSNYDFRKYRLSKFLKTPSIESKFDNIVSFYNDFISLKSVNIKPEKNTDRLNTLNTAFSLYDKLVEEYKKIYEREPKDDKSCDWKQKYDPKHLKALEYQPAELKTESLSDEEKSDNNQRTQLKQLNLNEITKPLWIEASRKDFARNKPPPKKKKNEACDLYDSLIKPDADTLKRSTSRGKGKRNNILTILDNIEICVFDVVYFSFSDKLSESEESIAGRAKLRRQISAEIKEKKTEHKQ